MAYTTQATLATAYVKQMICTFLAETRPLDSKLPFLLDLTVSNLALSIRSVAAIRCVAQTDDVVCGVDGS